MKMPNTIKWHLKYICTANSFISVRLQYLLYASSSLLRRERERERREREEREREGERER